MAANNDTTVVNRKPYIFFIFGNNISFSMSPIIHNAAFQSYNLPWAYGIYETNTVDALESIIANPAFGGSSVTMPHKITIVKHCNALSPAAKAIGAVNTLVIERKGAKRTIFGDNTDWLAISSSITTSIGSRKLRVGLVIGAGGASRAALYALYDLGVPHIYLHNRTKARAEGIAEGFSSRFHVTVLDSLSDVSADPSRAPDVIVGTIPAHVTSMEYFPEVLFRKKDGVCVEMSYKPRMTPLLYAVEKYGFGSWSTVAGVDVLLGQACGQFEAWTGLKSTQKTMKDALILHDAIQSHS